jgi:hypothetical protein
VWTSGGPFYDQPGSKGHVEGQDCHHHRLDERHRAGIAETLAAAGATVMLNGFGDAVRIEEIRRNLAERHGVRVA